MNKIIVANWKCNPQTITEAQRLFNMVKEGVKDIKEVKVVICPPFVYLPVLLGASTSARQGPSYGGLAFGSQDCFFQEGPFTGEISPKMLKNLGCQYVIVGHSERRALGESNELINKKIKAVLEEGLNPILCIGEKEKDESTRFKVIKNQLREALSTIEKSKLKNLIVAYEPVWAIGTGNACDSKEAKEANSFIKKILTEFFGEDLVRNILILYGGSVNSENAVDYIKESQMHGLLVGGTSLKSEEFVKVVKAVSQFSEVALRSRTSERKRREEIVTEG